MTAGTAARFRVRHYHRDPRGWHGQSVRAGSLAISREACDAVTGARQDDPIQREPAEPLQRAPRAPYGLSAAALSDAWHCTSSCQHTSQHAHQTQWRLWHFMRPCGG
jgi:hypothetical protein